MKKILALLFLLFIPLFAKANVREITSLKEYNTGYAYAYYIDGYIYGVYGRANPNDLIEKMDGKGETVYKIESEFTEDHEPIIFNDENYFYVVELVYLDPSDNYYFDIYVYKYDLKTGELKEDVKIEDYYIRYRDSELIADDNNIYILNNHDIYGTVINMDTFDTTTVDKDTILSGISLYDIGIAYDKAEFIDLYEEGNEDLKAFIAENELPDYYYIYKTKDFYFFSEGNEVNDKSVIVYIDKDLEDYKLIELKGNVSYISGAYQYNNKLLITYVQNQTLCLSAVHPATSYYPTPCGGPNGYVALFDVIYNVYTKTDGNGTIKVSSESGVEGDGITFEIIPKEGYVLSEVKVTDSDGNVITFKDYKFTMPTADVTIEAVFVLAVSNPVTKDLIIYIGVIAVLSFIALTIVVKEMKREKRLSI